MQDDYQTTGRIFDIQRFSVHDGPGIRTIVFLKGCFLRCQWCCNPESQEHGIQTMVQNGKKTTVGRDVTVAEVMDTVLRDRPYYRRSGGGMTLSGGEMLFQPAFALSLLRAAKDNGLNTAVESTGCTPFDVIAPLLPYIDVYLLDIKHMDSAKHKAFTGVPNEQILQNAPQIARGVKQLIVRVPVIPTFNATAKEIGAIARFAASLPGVKELHLLPYHRMGLDKYHGLGRPYTLESINPPDSETMEDLRQTAMRAGIYCQIGG